MQTSRGLKPGHIIALAGACMALGALWGPWYRVDLDALRNALQQRPGIAGTQVGGFLQSLMALLPHSVSGDAWEVLHRVDVLVAVSTVLAVLALLATAGTFGSAIDIAGDAAGRLVAAAGAASGVFVAGRILDPPGPNTYLEVRWGAWACLAGCALMVVGGLMASAEKTTVIKLDPLPPGPTVTGSVAPPG